MTAAVNTSETRKQKGNAGEDRAVKYLAEHGFEIVARNWRTKSGEIDIIAHKNDALIFIEVKTLPGGDALTLSHEMGVQKQKRIIKTSKRFLLNNRQYNNDIIRYDLIVIDMPRFPSVYHIENAFTESL